MIRSFADKRTRAIFDEAVPKSASRKLAFTVLKKLLILHAAHSLDDLRSPPGNRREALKGERAGQHSIRVDDQWRICFTWREGEAHAAELVDYH